MSSAKWRPFCPGGDEFNMSMKSLLVQVMAWCPFSAKPLYESILTYSQLYPKEHTSEKFINKRTISLQENASENIVCKMVAICLGYKMFNSLWSSDTICMTT